MSFAEEIYGSHSRGRRFVGAQWVDNGQRKVIEKTPGVDDVYIVTLDVNRCIQVDGSIFDAMDVNQTVNKRAWTTSIEIEGMSTPSPGRMTLLACFGAMPLAVCVLFAMIVVFRPC